MRYLVVLLLLFSKPVIAHDDQTACNVAFAQIKAEMAWIEFIAEEVVRPRAIPQITELSELVESRIEDVRANSKLLREVCVED